MRALVATAQGEPRQVLRVREVPSPVPGAGRVRLRVGAAACNLPDVLMCRGAYVLRPEVPFTPGLEAAGVVVETGPEVDPSLVGRRVVCVPELPYGGLAEECIGVAERLFALPDDGMPDQDAAAMCIAFDSAHVGLHRRAALASGEVLLVHAAAGGTGSAAVQLGAVCGARVIATAGSAEKLALCAELGAHDTIDYNAGPFAERVLELTTGHGADVVFDPVGGDIFDESRRCIANEGRILVVGFAGGRVPELRASSLLIRNYTVMGLYMGAYSTTPEGRALVQAAHADVIDLYRAGKVRPVVDRVVGLDGVAGALEDLGARRTTGKIVVIP
jgi:NADPH:quinone reductase